jgi:hypothetical protein
MYLHAMSPEEQARRLRDEMVVVHRGVLHYYKKTGKLPSSPDQIQTALSELKVRNAGKIKISTRAAGEPGAVIYVMGRSGFQIQAADNKGELLMTPSGTPLFFDQYFDSSTM